jgi:hypothetical protein
MRIKSCFGIMATIGFNKISKILECAIRILIQAAEFFNLSIELDFKSW